jgi:hypothetical protein
MEGRKMKKIILAGLLLLGSVAMANASYINSSSDTTLSGSAIIDFNNQIIGSYSSLNISGVTFSGSGSIAIDNMFGGQYNSTGLYLQNNSGNTLTLNFLFSDPISAFGFNFGASDNNYNIGDSPWTLTAYGTGNTLLESYTLPDTWSSNSGDFFGIARNGIVRAELSTQNFDYILLDNFKYVSSDDGAAPVPEPGTIALLGLGMAGLAFYGKRRQKKA